MKKGDENKKVLIVGLSSAIGIELCKLYKKKGYEIFATYHQKSLGSVVSNKCEKLLKTDLSKQKGIDLLLEFADEFKPANIVYLPGYIDGKNLYENDLPSIQGSFNVNLFAYLLLISKTCVHMKSIGYGRYLSISSIGSKYGGSLNGINYTLSKNALEIFPKEYKLLAKDNIFFNNIVCGVTNTSIFKNKTEEDLLSRVQKIPIGRMANPKEIALACYRLCSIENTFQTLSNTTISGGE